MPIVRESSLGPQRASMIVLEAKGRVGDDTNASADLVAAADLVMEEIRARHPEVYQEQDKRIAPFLKPYSPKAVVRKSIR